MSITVGTACSGIGGAEVALDLAGIPHENAWAIERAPHQAAVLRKRLGVRVLDDAYTSGRDNLERVDLFVAGFPCQPFSVAGRRGGERDPRNLWPEIARITEEIEPRVCLFENVPALRNPHPAGIVDESEDGEAVASGDALPGYLGTVLGDLVDLGYHVAWDGRSAANAGAWHRRDRVWIVAWKGIADFDPFRPEDVLLDAREIGRWDGIRWGLGDLFGSIPVVKWPRAGIVRGAVAFEVGTASVPDDRTAYWTTPIVGGANHRTQYAQGGWLWHPSLGDLQSPLAPRQKQTKNRLISLGNAWVPQTAVPIMARIVSAIVRTSAGNHTT